MTVMILTAATLALVVSLICLAALVEMYTNLETVQESLGLKKAEPTIQVLEEVTKTVISRPPADIGIRIPQNSPAWYVLFVSQHCATCHHILESLAEKSQAFLSVVVLGGESPSNTAKWLETIGEGLSDLATDVDFELFDQIGLILAPTVMVTIEDEMAYIAGVDSIGALNRVTIDKYLPPEVLAMRSGVPQI